MQQENYSKRGQFYTGDVPPLLSEFLNQAEWQTCLDLGCGDGALLSALDQLGTFHGKSVYAVDISETRIDKVKKINPLFNCIVSDACDCQLQDQHIDFLISTQVIEHVPDDHQMVKEMSRLLRDGGLLYLSTVQKKKYGWYFYRCNGKWTLDPTHVREYTEDKQLVEVLQKNGFEILANQKYLDGRPIMDAVLRRLHAPRSVYSNRLFRSLRVIRIPIPGYYQWELVCRKR